MHYRPLGRTGLNVSVLSYGASPLGGVFRATDDNEGIRTVRTALDLGINYLDTSPYYGATKSETVLGRALRGVPRERYFLATKIGQYGDGVFDFSAARVTRSLDESCARLGVDYVDVLQCHDIEFADLNQIVNETLPVLVRLRDAGRIGHIGITGLPLKIFPAILDRVAPGVVETILSFCRYELNDTALASLATHTAPVATPRCAPSLKSSATSWWRVASRRSLSPAIPLPPWRSNTFASGIHQRRLLASFDRERQPQRWRRALAESVCWQPWRPSDRVPTSPPSKMRTLARG